MKKKIFVTGSTGFIGANLVRKLIKENYDVHILKRKNSNIWRIKDLTAQLHSHEGDLIEKEYLSKLLHKIKPHVIFHLANLGLYGGIDSSLEESIKVNLLGTTNLIESADTIDYECFVNTGSSSEYGDKKKPMKEDNQCLPTSNYALTKLASTLYTQSYAKRTKKPMVTLRLFSPFGPFDQINRFIPQTIIKLLKNEEIIIKNPKAVRDYIFIDNVIDGFIKTIKHANRLSGEIINIGGGKQITLKDVLKLLAKEIESDSNIVYNSGKETKMMWQADVRKAKRLLEWEPPKSLTEGIRKTVVWFKENYNFYG